MHPDKKYILATFCKTELNKTIKLKYDNCLLSFTDIRKLANKTKMRIMAIDFIN